MKKVKKTKRYCPFCRKYTEQKVSTVSSGRARGSLKRGSPVRARKRGLARGMGSHGKWPPSKPAITQWKRKTKNTKKTNFLYTCLECNKSTLQKKGVRTGKITLEEKKIK